MLRQLFLTAGRRGPCPDFFLVLSGGPLGTHLGCPCQWGGERRGRSVEGITGIDLHLTEEQARMAEHVPLAGLAEMAWPPLLPRGHGAKGRSLHRPPLGRADPVAAHPDTFKDTKTGLASPNNSFFSLPSSLCVSLCKADPGRAGASLLTLRRMTLPSVLERQMDGHGSRNCFTATGRPPCPQQLK